MSVCVTVVSFVLVGSFGHVNKVTDWRQDQFKGSTVVCGGVSGATYAPQSTVGALRLQQDHYTDLISNIVCRP